MTPFFTTAHSQYACHQVLHDTKAVKLWRGSMDKRLLLFCGILFPWLEFQNASAPFTAFPGLWAAVVIVKQGSCFNICLFIKLSTFEKGSGLPSTH